MLAAARQHDGRVRYGHGNREAHAHDLSGFAAHERELIRERIIQAITRWEPRVTLQDVIVAADDENSRLVEISVLFRLVATQAPGRLGLTLQLEG